MKRKIIIVLLSVLGLAILLFLLRSNGLKPGEIRVGVNGIYKLDEGEKLVPTIASSLDLYMTKILPDPVSMPINKMVNADDKLILFSLGTQTNIKDLMEAWVLDDDHKPQRITNDKARSLIYKIDDQLVATTFVEDTKNNMIIGIHVLPHADIAISTLEIMTDKIENNLTIKNE